LYVDCLLLNITLRKLLLSPLFFSLIIKEKSLGENMRRRSFIFLLVVLSYGIHGLLPVDAADSVHVKSIRLGGDNQKTRLVLDLDHQADCSIQQKANNHFVISSDNPLDASNIIPQSHGLIKSVDPVREKGGGYTLHVHTTPGAFVKTSFNLDGQDSGKRYVVDFGFNPSLASSKKPSANMSLGIASSLPTDSAPEDPTAAASQDRSYLTDSLDATFKKSNPFQEDAPSELVKTLTIEANDSKTILILTLAKAGSFTVRENEYTHEVIIEMPKFDWTSTNLMDKSGGVIENYVVDDSDPNCVSLVLKVRPGTVVLGKFTLPQRNTMPPKFILTLGDENLSHPAPIPIPPPVQAPKKNYQPASSSTHHIPSGYEAAKTPPSSPGPEFLGGDTPFADVGTGLYLGIQGGYGSGNIKNTTTLTNNAPNVSNYNLNQEVAGGVSSLHMGYGFGFGKFYFGLEAFGQLMDMRGHTEAAPIGGVYTKYQDTFSILYGGLARIGAYLAPEVMIYGSVGGVGTVLTHKMLRGNSPNYGLSGRFKNNFSGTLLGMGLEAALDDHLSLRLDYHYIFYQVWENSLASLNDPRITQTSSMAPKLNQFLMGLSYKFSPMFGPNSLENQGVIPTGSYVGTGPSMASTNLTTKTYRADFKGLSSNQSMAPQWELYAGYGQQTGSFYMGGEATVTLGNKMIEESYTLNNIQEKRIEKLRSSLTLSLRSGFTFGQGNLLYGRVGAIMSRLTHDGFGPPNAQFTIPQNLGRTLYGLALGGGLEAFINKNLSIRGDYTYEDYQRIKLSAGGFENILGFNNSKFSLGVSYTF